MTCASNGDRAANLAGRRRMVSKLLRNIMAHDHQFLLHKPHVHLWNGRSGGCGVATLSSWGGGRACGRAAWTGARARAWGRAACACMGAPTSSASWGCAQLQVQTCSRHRASRHKHVSGWGRAARRNLDADEGAPRVRPSGSGHEARRGHGGSGEGGREACPVASLFGWEPNAGGQYGVSRTDRSARQQKYAPRGEHTDGKVSACEK